MTFLECAIHYHCINTVWITVLAIIITMDTDILALAIL
jgi:hypothetical protein